MTGNILKRKDLLFSVILFGFCAILRLLFVTDRDIALDEPFTLYYSQQSTEQIIAMLYNENNPPLHFLFLHYWIKIFGMSAFAVRLPSVVFSCLTAVVLYLIGSKFFNRAIGLTAGLILSLSSMHVFFSHEARVYPLFCLLTAGSLYFFLSIIQQPDKKSNYVYIFFLNLLLIYSHYFGFYVLFIEAFSILFLHNKKIFLKNFFLLFLAIGICYLPMIFIFLHRFGTSTANGTWVAPPGVTEVYGNINRFINNRINTAVFILIMAVTIIIVNKNGLLKSRLTELNKNLYFKIIFLWFVVPYMFMFLISFKYPMFIDRYILYTSIPLYLTLSFAIVYFQNNLKTSVICISVFLLSMAATLQLNPDNNRRLNDVAQTVKTQKKENTVVFLAPDYAYMGFAYHYNIDYFRQAPNTVDLLQKDNVFPVSDTTAIVNIFKKAQAPECIYIQAGTEFIDPQNTILNYLSSRYKKSSVTHVFEIYNIYHFSN
jgi:mannosyltransferase